MKTTRSVLFSALAFSVLLVSQPGWTEEGNSTLEVTGTLMPGICTPQLADGGIIDYGTIYGIGLISTSNQLGVKNIDLTIHCDSPTMVAIYSTDNRVDSQANVIVKKSWNSGNDATSKDKKRYGLGTTSGGKPIGAFTIGIDLENVQVDDLPVSNFRMLSTTNINAANISWSPSYADELWEHSYQGYWYAITPSYNDRFFPIPFTNATIPLIISAAVTKYKDMDTEEEINLDGNVTLSMIYL
ncbi:DUF1120 domain-containing protein [Salmonella enterica subsp. indica]|uniref:DUF1120 domain-containing protein n=1 Tax=Salmonella enterica subsp. arizonae TaxID=59203 RepID=A0A5Y2QPH3_SALER|nr:DUF1120 domain-containing protein [Salmonella enterica]EAW1718664.1 DUF1120 domain-containing protein [Salmonella enterica subsp. indica]ECF4924278.1 DUF1120 domain-containing protein [Salmonella enterica subsp. arizonae]HAE8196800.1 DUF1120 domain-containing protein [Salmonella enterica subsp. indica serovar 41:b:1,7]ECI9862953.1 DUF1120 domain-containing protein [Salmonella enterica subsp. arizonae]MBA3216412.1 DUF1120 domain-containing protein [Salmonella enterica]